jgi:hypothetical protein
MVGITLGLAIGTLSKAYMTEVRIPVRTRPLIAMSQAMDAGQAVSGEFKAGLRDVTPGVPRARWNPARLLEIIGYSLARTTPGAPWPCKEAR